MSRSRLLNVFPALFLLILLAQPAQAAPLQAEENAPQSGTGSPTPLLVPPPTVISISTSNFHTCELWSDGKIQCWGPYNGSGQLDVPNPNENWAQVSTGAQFTCARKNDNTLHCWGANNNGESTPPAGDDWMNLSSGAAHSCAAMSDGTLYCWGYSNPLHNQTTVPPIAPDQWLQDKFSAGDWHTCGIDTSGVLHCWGENNYGQGTVPAPNSNWIQVDGGTYHTCGIKNGGAVSCWGAGTTVTGSTPHRGQSIAPSGVFTQVSAGNLHTCGLKSDGTISCWGYGNLGRTTVPEPNANWVQVSAGYDHTCGLKADGTVRCWGDAPVLQLGPSSTLPHGDLGVAYATSLTASGSAASTPAYAFSLVSGSVPPGLTLNADGTWSGTTTTEGIFNFTVQVKDAYNFVNQRDYSLTIDSTPPTVTSITLAGASSTSAGSVDFTVIFSEPVIIPGGAVINFDLTTTGGITGESVTAVNGSNTTYTVSVDTGSGSGTIRLNVRAGASIWDLTDHSLTGLPFTGGEAYTIDKSSETAITADTPEPSLMGQAVAVTVTVTASETGGPVPSGTVAITGADTNCTITLDALATGGCDVVFNTAGAKTITAAYSGDAHYGGSTSIEAHQVHMAEHAVNGGFNTYSGTSKIPKNWARTNFASTDGKDTGIKKEGAASVRISGATGTTKTLTQTLSRSGTAGDAFSFSYWVKAYKMPTTGVCRGQVLFYYGTTLKGTKTLNCPTGATYNWQQVTLNSAAPAAYNKVVIKFTYSKASGKAWFDLASLLR